MRSLPEYPWDQMTPYRELAARHPAGALDLSIGSPVDPTPESAQRALAEAADAHAYPTTTGPAALRDSIAAWFGRRRGVTLDRDHVLPTIGSKEFIALLPFALGLGQGDVVVIPEIAYPTYEMGAHLVGATPCAADDPAAWPTNTKLVWLNSPANPHGRVLDIHALQAAVRRARALGAVIVGDECYSEFGWEAPWDDTPIPSILDARVVGNHVDGVLAANSLSKQANLAGYRAAFVAGDRELIASLTTLRKHAGLIVPAPIQAAMIRALGDDASVADQVARYRARREMLLPAVQRAGFRIDHSEAGLYLWATQGVDAWESVQWFARRGIVVGPGHFYGTLAPEHVRVALTATDETIRSAAERLQM